AAAVVADEAELVARAVCAVITVVDPELVVLGGGIGQAPGFAVAVAAQLRSLAPVMPDVRVSALGTEAVVDGCLASGAELAWHRLTALPRGPHCKALWGPPVMTPHSGTAPRVQTTRRPPAPP